MTNYITVAYDNEATGPFVAEGANVTWTGGGVGFIVTLIDEGSTGRLIMALVAGAAPSDNDVLTQGSTTADTNAVAPAKVEALLYPAYFREDVSLSSAGVLAWTGPALGTTHSFFFDGQTANVVATEVLTWSGGQQCEVITVESDAGATGELSVRWITDLDTLGLPADNDTFTGSIAGDGTLNGVVHPRAYNPLQEHRLLADLNDDQDIVGNDDWSMVDATASSRDTDQIVNLLAGITMDDTIAQHMFGGSVSQLGGDTLYSGVDVQVTSPNADTQPILIQYDPATGTEAVITDYWSNAFMPDSVAGNVRILRKTRDEGVDIDSKRIKGKLAEYGDFVFEGSTTLGTASTALALFSSDDGNNNTAEGTVAGAPYNTIVLTEGFQTLDYNNGNGATPYYLQLDIGSATKPQAYERTKYIQRRGTAETLFGRNAILFTGVVRNFGYDTPTGAAFVEDNIIAWGTEITYSNEASGPFTIGAVVDFVGSGAIGRLIFLDDDGTTGVMIFDMDPASATPLATDTLAQVGGSQTADVDTVVTNTNAGLGVIYADDTTGNNLYYQNTYGFDPVDNQTVFSVNAGAIATADVNGTVATRTINNQFIGVFTSADFQTNFGIGLDPNDAQVNDQLRNLLGTVQQPPNNQSGEITGVAIGDVVTCYPWDGVSTDANGDPEPDFNQMTLAVALTAGVSTIVDVGTGNIPDNQPASGALRIERDLDSNLELVPYSAHNGDDQFTILAADAPTAAISNTVMTAYMDEVATATTVSFTAVFGPGTQLMTLTVRRGGVDPIKPNKLTPTFGSTGFSVGATRTPDA